jgi:hypothetical protein
MKEPHIEGVATRDDPESCAGTREGAGEALTGARTGSVLSRENRQSGAPTPLSEAEGNMTRGRYRESSSGPARSKTRRTCGDSLRENREVPVSPAADGAGGRAGKANGRAPAMHDPGKSDRPVVRAGQRAGQEGQSPSGARMRGVVSKDGGNASSVEERGRYGEP